MVDDDDGASERETEKKKKGVKPKKNLITQSS